MQKEKEKRVSMAERPTQDVEEGVQLEKPSTETRQEHNPGSAYRSRPEVDVEERVDLAPMAVDYVACLVTPKVDRKYGPERTDDRCVERPRALVASVILLRFVPLNP
jgi:hypothetical protein